MEEVIFFTQLLLCLIIIVGGNMLTQLRIFRMTKGIKLIELAELSGVSVSFLSQIETGKFKGTKKTRRKIAFALGISEELLFGK